MGGTWAVRSKERYEISRRVGAALFAEIDGQEAEIISTECAGCQIQIARSTGYSGDRMIHAVRIWEEAIM